jgi:hypothetical protein
VQRHLGTSVSVHPPQAASEDLQST